MFNGLVGQVSSHCSVNPMLYQYYDKDVKNATLQWAAKCDSSYLTDSIAIPKMIEDSVWGALAAVFNVQNMPERDSVIDMYCIHQSFKNHYIQELFIGVDPEYTWTDNWFNGELISGIPIVDSILVNYEYEIERIFPNIDGIVFKSEQAINLRPLCEILKKVDGIIYAEPNYMFGDGNEFWYESSETDRYLFFDKAWGDCMAGCYMHHIWQFKVDENCDVQYMGTIQQYNDDESLGEPWNCNITGLIDPNENNKISIWPNPANNSIKIVESDFNYFEVFIRDINGKIIHKQLLYSGEEIDISTFNSGLYIIEIPESNIREKFIKF